MSSTSNLIRALLLCLLPGLAQAATVTFAVSTPDTGATSNTSGAFTPAEDDLLVVFAFCPGTLVTTAQLTSSVGGFTFSQAANAVRSTNEQTYLFVSDALVSSATSQTVSFAVSGDECTGSIITVYRVSGMTLTGTDAVLQTAKTEDATLGQPPAATFASSADTANPTLGVVWSNSLTSFTEPSGWSEGADTQLDDTADHTQESVYRNSGFTGTTITWGANSNNTHSVIIAELDTSTGGVAVNFTSGPTVAAASGGYTISGTLNGSGFGALTAYSVGVSPGDGTPSCTQIKAGQNDGGTAALLAASEAWTTDVGDSFALTGSNVIARMDVHTCASDGTNDTSVTSAADQNRSPRSGFALVVMASPSVTGVCALDSYFNPDCADGDVFEYEDDTNESADCNVSFETDGDFTLTPVAPGDCDGKQTFNISYEDVSSATTGLFTAPTVGNFTTDDLICVNNSAPEAGDPFDQPFAWTIDEAIEAIDLTSYITDADGDTLTFTLTSGSWPTGISQSGTGNKDVTGTPTVEDEAGVALEITGTDECGDSATYTFYSTTAVDFYVIDTWTLTDLSGLTTAGAETAIVADAPWRLNTPGITVSGQECSEETEGTIISQDPEAAAEVGAYDAVSVVTAVSCGDPATERKVVYVLEDLTGLVRWVDYIPVVEKVGCEAGTFNNDGCWATLPLSSTTGKTAWVDYIPVGVVDEIESGKWRYENNGWIPVDDLTP